MGLSPDFCALSAGSCVHCWGGLQPDATACVALVLGPLETGIAVQVHEALQARGIEHSCDGESIVIPNVVAICQPLGALLLEQLPAGIQMQVQIGRTRECTYNPAQMEDPLFAGKSLPIQREQLSYIWVYEAFLKEGLFSVFHPILEARSGALFAYEALIRARHPVTGQVLGAGSLLEACHALGLNRPLDQCARRTAIRCAASNHLQDTRLFINFMPGTIYNPELCLQTTLSAAMEYGLTLNKIVFEVVENEQITDMRHLRRILDYYRAQGMASAVDDLGSGYTTLDYLTELQPDYVKIDREMVVRAASNPEAERNLASVIAAAKDLDIQVIAEGIETEAQKRVCIEAGADFLQGFLFARPANPPEKVLSYAFSGL